MPIPNSAMQYGNVAEQDGFEPPDTGVKFLCVTASQLLRVAITIVFLMG